MPAQSSSAQDEAPQHQSYHQLVREVAERVWQQWLKETRRDIERQGTSTRPTPDKR